jgi:hypothetical protein
MADAKVLLDPLLALHARIREAVHAACTTQSASRLAGVAAEEAGDTIYAIDRVSEEVLVPGLTDIARREPMVLVAEGIPGGMVTLPEGTPEAECRWRMLFDPIDGTRGLMYQKRSGWILTGVAPNNGAATRLRDIVLAVQTEIPLVKQHLCDQLWAERGNGVSARRINILGGASTRITLQPSRDHTIAHGFATVVRFFPGARDVLAAVDDDLVRASLGTMPAGRAACFEDQYASTGGQLYELMAGHDRFIADLRPLVHHVQDGRGLPRGLCCHPYDLCTALIAEELGVSLAGSDGGPLDAPFDTTSDVAWVGYGNHFLRAGLEGDLLRILRRHGLLPA